MIKGRFAPSPSGRMHAGNIYASLMAWLCAKGQGGEIVLRIEDLDRERSKPEFIEAIPKDYEMLGLSWDEGPFYQHDRDQAYARAFDCLESRGLIYPCYCSRAELIASAPHRGEKQVYAGTCRGLTSEQRAERTLQKQPGYRLMVPNADISFSDAIQGPYCQNLASECGDFLLKRSDGAFAYQLAVVLDDAEQGINSVVRGVDLLCSTPQQMYLQDLLCLPHPEYVHIPLLVSAANKRLSKRDKSANLDEMLERYGSPEGVIGHIAFVTKLIDADEGCTPEELLKGFDLDAYKRKLSDSIQIQWS